MWNKISIAANIENKKRGVTLIEVMIYTLIFSYVLLLVSNLLYLFLSFWQNSRARKAVIQNTTEIYGHLWSDLKRADTIILPENDQYSDTLTINIPDIGQVVYQTANGVVTRNSQPLTDGQISSNFGGGGGFRLINNTVDFTFQVTANHILLSGNQISREVRGTVFLENIL